MGIYFLDDQDRGPLEILLENMTIKKARQSAHNLAQEILEKTINAMLNEDTAFFNKNANRRDLKIIKKLYKLKDTSGTNNPLNFKVIPSEKISSQALNPANTEKI